MHRRTTTKHLHGFYSYLNISTDGKHKFKTAWSRQRTTTIPKFHTSSSYRFGEKFPTFAVIPEADRCQKTQQISFASSPRFVRSHAINLHTWKVFLSPHEVKLSEECYLACRIVDLPVNSPTEKKISSPDFFQRRREVLQSLYPRRRFLAGEVSACCFLNYFLSPSVHIHLPKSSQTKLSQDALRA